MCVGQFFQLKNKNIDKVEEQRVSPPNENKQEQQRGKTRFFSGWSNVYLVTFGRSAERIIVTIEPMLWNNKQNKNVDDVC